MLTKDRVVNLVAVRLKSTRLPGKALLLLQGKPVLGHLMDRVSRSNIPEKTVICTSTHSQDDAICEFAMTNNSSFFRGHPENVLLRFIEAAEEHSASHIVRITGDNPLTDPFLIDEMIEKHKNYTGSTVAEHVLKNWDKILPQLVKVYPKDYRRVIEEANHIRKADQAAVTKK